MGKSFPSLGVVLGLYFSMMALGMSRREDITLYVCLLPSCHDPCLSIHSDEVLSSEVGHIDVGKSSEAGEEKEVTDELKARDGQLLVGYL